ncbi:MAG: type II toxin-antitoxin system RelE/ParE family toxin [Alphaproteobacteria bacterium]
MASYRLSNAAGSDIDRLFVFGFTRFGLKQADSYVEGLYERLDDLAENPERWQAVAHIRAGLRCSKYGSHSIYYRIEPAEIVILRILGREDPHRQFSPTS